MQQAANGANNYPFQHLRVLDFGIGAVGVEVGRLFAEYGADVIKIESRTYPDFIRVLQGGTMAPSFASSSRSKRSFGVNLRSEKGREILYSLVRVSDIIVENSGTGVMERMGVSYDAVREINPRIIMISSQLLGRTGPWSSWVGYGPSTHPVSGLSYLWNYAEDAGQPLGSQNIYPDHLAGRVGALIGVAALIQRQRTGSGSHVDVAQFETPVGLMGDIFLSESLNPGSAQPQGNASLRGAPWGVYPCDGEDAWCVINVRDDSEWQRLRAVMNDPDWARKREFDTATGRIRHREEIDAHLSEWTVTRSARDVMLLLQEQGIPAGIVQNPADQMTDPHLTERGYHKPIDQPPLGRIVLEGPAFRGSALPEPIIKPAPDLGEHTREVCMTLLNMSEAEVERLIAEGVLEEPGA